MLSSFELTKVSCFKFYLWLNKAFIKIFSATSFGNPKSELNYVIVIDDILIGFNILIVFYRHLSKGSYIYCVLWPDHTYKHTIHIFWNANSGTSTSITRLWPIPNLFSNNATSKYYWTLFATCLPHFLKN